MSYYLMVYSANPSYKIRLILLFDTKQNKGVLLNPMPVTNSFMNHSYDPKLSHQIDSVSIVEFVEIL